MEWFKHFYIASLTFTITVARHKMAIGLFLISEEKNGIPLILVPLAGYNFTSLFVSKSASILSY